MAGGIWSWGRDARPDLFDLGDELDELFAFALADIEETNANLVALVNGLCDTGEAERQAVQVKLDFHPATNSKRKAILGAELAPVQTQIQNPAAQADARIEQLQSGSAIHAVPGFFAAFRFLRWGRGYIVFRRHSYLLIHRQLTLNGRPSMPMVEQAPVAQLRDLAGGRTHTNRS